MARSLQTLKEMLHDPHQLATRPRETAKRALMMPDRMSGLLTQSFGMDPTSRLERIAQDHEKRVAATTRKPDPPSEIERELKALADLTGRFANNIKILWDRQEYMDLIQAEADQGWKETLESDTP